MRRIVLIIPEWLDPSRENSALHKAGPVFEQLASRSEIFKIPKLDPEASDELAYFGIDSKRPLAQGPLSVAAFGADPPARSVHFHLSLASLESDSISKPSFELPARDLDLIMALLERLNTRHLTIVKGEGLNHALVWEDGSIDVGTAPLSDEPLSFAADRPEGDGERVLRRFIDDSVNLLHELELNVRRIDEGLPPINIAWPWGQGFREPMPNLPLLRGEPARIESGSLRLAGLAKLLGYRHGDRALFGTGVNIRFEKLVKAVSREPLVIVVLRNVAQLRRGQKLEEIEWLTREIGVRLLAELNDPPSEDPVRLTVLAPGAEGGVGLVYRSNAPVEGLAPFDERALEERGLNSIPLWQAVDRAVAP